jgi:energy-converting hydrogenase Eha subunit G
MKIISTDTRIILIYIGFAIFTFINASISASGLIFAAFSRLDSSVSISEKKNNRKKENLV